MSRESCIQHPAKQKIAMVREDYYEMLGRDATAAAILNVFEYWANCAIGLNPKASQAPDVGEHSINEFQELLLGIATDKQIRLRLKKLESMGLISSHGKAGFSKSYRVNIAAIQAKIDAYPRSNDQPNLGQTTEPPRSNNRTPSVKQPNPLGQTTEVQPLEPLPCNGFSPPKEYKEYKEDSQIERDSFFSDRKTKESSKPVAEELPVPVKEENKSLEHPENPEQDLSAADFLRKNQINDSFWDLRVCPHQDDYGFSSALIEAVFRSYPGSKVFRLESGKPNTVAINRHLGKLQSSARMNHGNDSIIARRNLVDLWRMADSIRADWRLAEQQKQTSGYTAPLPVVGHFEAFDPTKNPLWVDPVEGKKQAAALRAGRAAFLAKQGVPHAS